MWDAQWQKKIVDHPDQFTVNDPGVEMSVETSQNARI